MRSRADRGTRRAGRALYLALPFAAFAVAGCDQEMAYQPRVNPLASSDFFADGRSARPAIDGTVARGQLEVDDHLYRGKVGGALVTTFPFPVTGDVLERGRTMFDAFCSPCHGRIGDGYGMVARRGMLQPGYRRPASFHVDRLRDAPAGQFFDVITNGFGAMPSYAAQVHVKDRWAIVAYVRALQLSQHATLADVPADVRIRLEEARK